VLIGPAASGPKGGDFVAFDFFGLGSKSVDQTSSGLGVKLTKERPPTAGSANFRSKTHFEPHLSLHSPEAI
jgi:hypothetical protein